MPGGVNSPVRAFRSVGTKPLIVSRAKGSKIYDTAGKSFTDLVMSWGALILGHAHTDIIAAAKKAMEDGSSFGALCEREIRLAQLICEAVGSIEKLRFVSSGTEAAMTAVRLARAFTGREIIVKFEGCYHGHSDFLLAKAGSGLATYGLAGSAGVPQAASASTIVLPFNDSAAVNLAFRKFKNKIAAVIVEPVPANMGVVLAAEGFLKGLEELCKRHGALLICDEVISGFRLGYTAAQLRYGVSSDLTIFGKIIGGGFPAAAVAGRGKIMDQLAPLGPVYQAGTLSGNPVAMAAGAAALEFLKREDPYPMLDRLGERLEHGLMEIFSGARIPVHINRLGSMMTVFFSSGAPRNYEEVKNTDTRRFIRFFRKMYRAGVFLAPSAFEAWFLSAAHTVRDVDHVLDAAKHAVRGRL